MTANLHNHSRCPRCGRNYHKTNRGPNVPYTAYDERLIEGLAARGFSAGQIAAFLNDINSVRAPGCIRNAQNIREKARHMGVKLQPAIKWRNQHGPH